jgi:hypothetical protein
MNTFRAACISCILLSVSFCVAQTITGTVHNETTGKPSAGDDVILLRLANGMLEEAHTKTDGQGKFTLNVQFADLSHVVRVLHQGVNYDQTVTSNTALDMNVFEAAPKIKEIVEPIVFLQMQSDGKSFQVTELHAVDNTSAPPRTQSNPRNFETFLPPNAQLDSVMVKGPRGIATKITPAPVPGEAGHYTMNFPLRPGETQFAVRYHLPAQEKLTFHPRLVYPATNLGIMYPPSMRFSSLGQGKFTPQSAEGRLGQTISNLNAGEMPGFEISGVGMLPRATQALPPSAPAPSKPPATAGGKSATPQTSAGQVGGSAPHESNWTWWALLAGAFVLVGLLVFVIWRLRSSANQRAAREALKEKLFQLENARLRGSISPEQYAATKQTLNQSLEQLVSKGAQGQ